MRSPLTPREVATYAAGRKTPWGTIVIAGEQSFDEFWQHYLRHHAQGGTRSLHFIGTAFAVVALVIAVVTVNPFIALTGTALGYLLAWAGHLLVERNRPAMVSRPLWSFQCDVRIFRLTVTGHLGPELKRAGLT
jgi:hypothetical protein